MYIDAQLLFSDAQVLTTTAVSTNVVDLGVAKNLFDGEALALVITIDTAADTTTNDETYVIAVQGAPLSNFSSPVTISSTTFNNASGNIAQLGLNKQVVLPISVGTEVPRFIRLNYTLSGTTPSVTLTAFLSPLDMVSKFRTYVDKSTIS